jgi:heat shock protein HtpX
MNLLEQQASNRRRTFLVMGLFVLFFAFLGVGFDLFLLGASDGYVPLGSLLALGVGSASAAAGFYSGDKAVLASTGATPLLAAVQTASEDDRHKLRQLQNVVDEMAIASGLPRPRVYLVPDQDPNAFATGRDPEHASIAVTRGLLDVMSRDELQGVIAHEMSHVRNYDIRLMTVIAALVGAIVLLADWSRRMMWLGGGRSGRRGSRSRDGGGAAMAIAFVVWLIAIILAPLLAQLLAMGVSRQREYLADASGAELTRNPGALADALQRIEGHAEPTRAIKRGAAHLCIADPLGRRMGLKEGFWSDLFATHPPMAKRIAALRRMAYQPATASLAEARRAKAGGVGRSPSVS